MISHLGHNRPLTSLAILILPLYASENYSNEMLLIACKSFLLNDIWVQGVDGQLVAFKKKRGGMIMIGGAEKTSTGHVLLRWVNME